METHHRTSDVNAVHAATATVLLTPLGRRVKVIEHGVGTPIVFLHSGVGSAGEWKQVFSLWPEGYRLVAIQAYLATAAPDLVDSLTLIEPEAYALLRTQDAEAYAQIVALRDRWRVHVRAGRWYDAFEEFIDLYNGRGSFAGWPRHAAKRFSPSSRPEATCGTSSSTSVC